ncbi:hypothetical protein I3760_14G062700 [Carya illinoinensis]|nr:hypothetical protein I3760_14G062700 [Carya illinoinensis]
MAAVVTCFSKFLSIFLLLLHLGCFIFSTTTDRQHSRRCKSFHLISLPFHSKPNRAYSSWSFFKRIFSSISCKTSGSPQTQPITLTTLSSGRSSQHSALPIIQPESPLSHYSFQESDISFDNPFFPLRNDIFPCTACGEIFPNPHLLEQHQAIKHAVSELAEGDSGKNIVRIIFQTGWTDDVKSLKINRILKIQNSPMILSKFEEYRESVKAKAARIDGVRRRDERCIADGNELLRFHCSTFLCDLGLNGNSGVCDRQYCSVCGIIKSGFSPKLDGISTLSTSWSAHLAIPEEIEEFRLLNVKRAMLVCRVVAGRIGCDSDDEVEKKDGGFDSVVGRGAHARIDDEELLVFNPRAVLACFVIVYTV